MNSSTAQFGKVCDDIDLFALQQNWNAFGNYDREMLFRTLSVSSEHLEVIESSCCSTWPAFKNHRKDP